MSRSVWIVLLLLAIWIFLGIYFWRNNPFENSNNAKNSPCVVSWELKDASNVIAKSDATFNFAESSANIKQLDPSLTEAVNKISSYLKKNSKKVITIIGYHDHEETNANGTLRELALARANVVKSLLTKKGVPDSQLQVKPMVYDHKKENSDCVINGVINRGASFLMGASK